MDEKKKPSKQSITHRKKEEPTRKHKFAAFDFETSALDGHVVFGTLQYELEPDGERSTIQDVYHAAGMLDLMLEHNQPKMRWYAHNLEYDLLFLLEEGQTRIKRGELKRIDLCERGMGNFYKAIFHTIDDKKLELYDSMALFGFSLKIFLKQFSTVGEKLELDFEKENFDVSKDHHIAYARQDTTGLLDAMVNFDRAIYKIFGVHAKGTISSTALAAWETTLKKDDKFYKLTKKQNDFAREAYFGGIVFMTDSTEKADCLSIDRNSSYPASMREYGVPYGKPEFTRTFRSGYPGLYRAKFAAPASLDFGCIGFRDKKGIAWPRGTFKSVAFDFEIERAWRWGYEIEIIEGLFFPESIYPFSDFVDKCETERQTYKNQPFEIVVKLIQNSVYGKFGTNEDGSEIAIFSEDDEIPDDWYPYLNPNTGAMVLEGVYKKDTERDTYYMFPHWAACITARAREALLDLVELAGGGAIYGDTDSVKMPRETFEEIKKARPDLFGTAYGQWKLDGEYKHFRAIAPKVYAYVSRETFSGKGKGIPEKQRTAQFWESVFYGDRPTVEYKTLQSLQTALKNGGVRKLNDATRTSTDLANSVGWVDNNGKVKAITIINGEREK